MTEQQPREQSLLDRLQAMHPDRNVAFTAVEQLRVPEDMATFFVQYAKWLSTSEDPKVRQSPFEVASENLTYITGYYGYETVERWTNFIVETSEKYCKL